MQYLSQIDSFPRFCIVLSALQVHADLSVYSKFWGIKYSYIQAIVLAIVDYLPKNPRAEFL